MASAAALAVAVVATLAVLFVVNRVQSLLSGRIEARRELQTWDDRMDDLPDDVTGGGDGDETGGGGDDGTS